MKARLAAALPQKQRSRQRRRLILVDIENVNGGALASEFSGAAARVVVEEAARMTSLDQVVVAAGPASAASAGFAWRSARLRVGHGRNGADLELLDVIENEDLHTRYDEIVLASGDGIFADAVARLGGFGVTVVVLAREGALSRRLEVAAASTLILNNTQADFGDVA